MGPDAEAPQSPGDRGTTLFWDLWRDWFRAHCMVTSARTALDHALAPNEDLFLKLFDSLYTDKVEPEIFRIFPGSYCGTANTSKRLIAFGMTSSIERRWTPVLKRMILNSPLRSSRELDSSPSFSWTTGLRIISSRIIACSCGNARERGVVPSEPRLGEKARLPWAEWGRSLGSLWVSCKPRCVQAHLQVGRDRRERLRDRRLGAAGYPRIVVCAGANLRRILLPPSWARYAICRWIIGVAAVSTVGALCGEA